MPAGDGGPLAKISELARDGYIISAVGYDAILPLIGTGILPAVMGLGAESTADYLEAADANRP